MPDREIQKTLPACPYEPRELSGARRRWYARAIVIVGALLLIFGLEINAVTVLPFGVEGTPDVVPPPDDPAAPRRLRESQVVKEVTIGGLERLASGAIRQTYVAGDAPDACPT